MIKGKRDDMGRGEDVGVIIERWEETQRENP
jgi:hypothetical protein